MLQKKQNKPAMEILYVSYDLWFLSIHVKEIIRGFLELGASVELLIPDNVPSDDALDKRCMITKLDSRGKSTVRATIRFNVKLVYTIVMRVFTGAKPNLIYARQSYIGFLLPILCRILNVPYFAEFNGSVLGTGITKPNSKVRVKSFLEFICARFASRCFMPSETLRKRFSDLYGIKLTKMETAYNGVNEHIFFPVNTIEARKKNNLLNDSDFVVGFIGSMGVWQGIDILKSAMPVIEKKVPSIRYLLVGDYVENASTSVTMGSGGEATKNLKEFTKQSGGETMIVTGAVSYSESARYMNMCDILVAPYTPEYANKGGGSPMKLYSYLGCGKPVIISDLGEFTDAEMLRKFQAAYLIKPGDVQSLANAIITLYEDEKLRTEIAKNGLNFVLKNRRWVDSSQLILKAYASLFVRS